MNEDTCRKAFEEWRENHRLSQAEYDAVINAVGEDASDILKWGATAFFAAWNLKPKLSVEEIAEIIDKLEEPEEDGDDRAWQLCCHYKIAQAIYDKQENL